jgi:membrane protease YdiL (CAAX protease family)
MSRSKKNIALMFILITLGLTWIIQFLPIIMKMDIYNTSISSFDYASVFFIIGGMLPSLIGGIFVLLIYTKYEKKAFFKRCFIPTKQSWICILLSLLFICTQAAVTQFISRTFFNAEPLGFEGLKLIVNSPYMLFYFLFWGLISGPLSEEIGWRGFLQETLLKNKSVLKTSVIIGFVECVKKSL